MTNTTVEKKFISAWLEYEVHVRSLPRGDCLDLPTVEQSLKEMSLRGILQDAGERLLRSRERR